MLTLTSHKPNTFASCSAPARIVRPDVYGNFLAGKRLRVPTAGFDPQSINPQLFKFQQDIVRWALKRGRASIFADCGLGKTPMQLEWARHISAHGPVLGLCPLAVAAQTVEEGKKFGVEVHYHRHGDDVDSPITITNYEMLENFDPSRFAGVFLDESSILKHYDGKFRTRIIQSFRDTPFRLACTATPAPNDHMELGNHAEFCGAMSRSEMLSRFFVHDGGRTSHWRLKGHAEKEFWKWVCEWAVLLRKPSDLGYDDTGFILPPLTVLQQTVESEGPQALTLQERIAARRSSLSARVAKCVELIGDSPEPWLIWCNLNAEADALEEAIPGAIQVKGSERPEWKTTKLTKFTHGEITRLITKPSIAGFGLNWQHCPNVVFVGLSDSWEDYYQCVRRCWRFGQQRPVKVHLITSTAEGAVLENIQRKEADADKLSREMIVSMHSLNEANLKVTTRHTDEYKTAHSSGQNWEIYLGDCVEVASRLRDDSIGFSVFSPPFSSLYTYSSSERDMGNSRSDEEFFTHIGFLAKQMFRITGPGRNLSFHCMNLPMTKCYHGVIGIRDFRGDLIRLFQQAGFVFHSEVCIWKNPVVAMQRTKAIGLLWKQLKKDSTLSRQGIADYLVTMRKPGENLARVAHTPEEFPVDQWQKWASPVWMDINPSDTLQYRSVRQHKDEKHICPLQLEVIRRAIRLWSNPGDLVFSPFAGIGSEGVVALEEKRQFIGAELKESYYQQAAANLQVAQNKPILNARLENAQEKIVAEPEFYVCPAHEKTDGYESCCPCEGDRNCSAALEVLQ